MGLEAVMICVDNSEWSRNGDYTPSRFDGQNEAANLLAGHKTGQNPETGVGLMTMAGERAEIHLTPSTDLGILLVVGVLLPNGQHAGNAAPENGFSIPLTLAAGKRASGFATALEKLEKQSEFLDWAQPLGAYCKTQGMPAIGGNLLVGTKKEDLAALTMRPPPGKLLFCQAAQAMYPVEGGSVAAMVGKALMES
eukprot:g12095.t1